MDLKEKKSQQVAIKCVTDGKYHVMYVRDIINISKCKNTDHAEVVFRDRRFGVTKSIESNLTISDFDDILPNNFHRIDRSNIINLDFVVFYDSTYVVVERYTDQCAFIHKNSITQKMIEL